jgi:hypothetical protein
MTQTNISFLKDNDKLLIVILFDFQIDPLQVIALYPNLLPDELRPKYHIPSEIIAKERIGVFFIFLFLFIVCS